MPTPCVCAPYVNAMRACPMCRCHACVSHVPMPCVRVPCADGMRVNASHACRLTHPYVPSMHPDHAPSMHPDHAPSMHPDHVPSMHSDHAPSMHPHPWYIPGPCEMHMRPHVHVWAHAYMGLGHHVHQLRHLMCTRLEAWTWLDGQPCQSGHNRLPPHVLALGRPLSSRTAPFHLSGPPETALFRGQGLESFMTHTAS
eukprot:354837-Chlamydomonas_euryale.AAC.3